MSQLDKRDPRTAHPVPPFPAPPQGDTTAPPRITPEPDYGATSYRGTGRLSGYRGLVTGAASGIGRAAAIGLAREGADLVLNYLPREQAAADETADLLRAEGRRIVLAPGDLTDERFCGELIARAIDAFGGLDTLVLVAGRQKVNHDIATLSTADFDLTMKTNLYSAFWLVRAAVPVMEPGSTIVTTSSVSAYNPQDRLLDYAVTKAGLITFTNGLARQLASRGIRANCVVPGPIWTPIQQALYGSDEVEHYGEGTPFGRPGQPVELASAYVHLAGPESSYTSGTTLVVGGATGPAL